MDTWNKRLKDAVEDRKVKTVDLAKAVGVKQPAVSQWLTGKTKKIDAEYAIKVCKHLDISMEWLFFNTGTMNVVKNDTYKRKALNKLIDELPEAALDESLKRINDLISLINALKKSD